MLFAWRRRVPMQPPATHVVMMRGRVAGSQHDAIARAIDDGLVRLLGAAEREDRLRERGERFQLPTLKVGLQRIEDFRTQSRPFNPSVSMPTEVRWPR